MATMAAMKDNVTICKKANADTSPEGWVRIGGPRRIALMRMSDRAALEAGAALAQTQYQPTHEGTVAASTDFAIGRVLVRKGDDQNYMILGTSELGRRNAGTPARYLKLTLAEMPTRVSVA